MKLFFVLTLVFSISTAAVTCKKNIDPTAQIPVCIQGKIDTIKAQQKWNPPATVYEYEYKGKIVYLFSSDCCDQFNPVFDAACNYICSPSGGITGGGDGRCSDFNQEARQIKLVWKDER